MKKVFKIPVSWTMHGVVPIEAETLEEAIAIAEKDLWDLPEEETYTDDSGQVLYENIEYVQDQPWGKPEQL